VPFCVSWVAARRSKVPVYRGREIHRSPYTTVGVPGGWCHPMNRVGRKRPLARTGGSAATWTTFGNGCACGNRSVQSPSSAAVKQQCLEGYAQRGRSPKRDSVAAWSPAAVHQESRKRRVQSWLARGSLWRMVRGRVGIRPATLVLRGIRTKIAFDTDGLHPEWNPWVFAAAVVIGHLPQRANHHTMINTRSGLRVIEVAPGIAGHVDALAGETVGVASRVKAPFVECEHVITGGFSDYSDSPL